VETFGMWKPSACGNLRHVETFGMWNELIKNQLVNNFFKIIAQATRLRKRMKKTYCLNLSFTPREFPIFCFKDNISYFLENS